MSTFDQFANQGGPAADGPAEMAEAKRVAEEHLRNADYDGHVPEPLGDAGYAMERTPDSTMAAPLPDGDGSVEPDAGAEDADLEFADGGAALDETGVEDAGVDGEAQGGR